MSINRITQKCDRILTDYDVAAEGSRSGLIEARVTKTYHKYQVLIATLQFFTLPLGFIFWTVIDAAIRGRATTRVDDAIALKKLRIIKNISNTINDLNNKGMSLNGLSFDQAKALLKTNGTDLDDTVIKKIFLEDQELILSLAQNFDSYTSGVDKTENVQSVWKKVFKQGVGTQNNPQPSISAHRQNPTTQLLNTAPHNVTVQPKDLKSFTDGLNNAYESEMVKMQSEKKTPSFVIEEHKHIRLTDTLVGDARRGLAAMSWKDRTQGSEKYDHVGMSQDEEIGVLQGKLGIIIDLISEIKETHSLDDNEALEELANILTYSVTQQAGCFLSSSINKHMNNSTNYYPSNQKVSVNFAHDPANKSLTLQFTGRFGLSTASEKEKGDTKGTTSESGGSVSFNLKMEIKTDSLSAAAKTRKESIASFAHQENLFTLSTNIGRRIGDISKIDEIIKESRPKEVRKKEVDDEINKTTKAHEKERLKRKLISIENEKHTLLESRIQSFNNFEDIDPCLDSEKQDPASSSLINETKTTYEEIRDELKKITTGCTVEIEGTIKIKANKLKELKSKIDDKHKEMEKKTAGLTKVENGVQFTLTSAPILAPAVDSTIVASNVEN